MKFSKLTMAIAVALTASASSSAIAMNLYVDTKTKQIYAEPGRGRILMGEFEKVGDKPQVAPAADAAEIAAVRQDLDMKTNEIKALQEHAEEAHKAPSVEITDNGFEMKSKDGNFTAAVNGRMQVDSQVNMNQQTAIPTGANTTNHLSDGTTLRRARLGVEGTFFKDWGYKFEYDFTRGNGTVAAGVTDAYIKWSLDKAFSVKVGAFKEPFSMEEATSNRYITFIQRNMAVDTFVDNLNTYKVGIGANYAADRWQTGVSLQTEPVGNNGQTSASFGAAAPFSINNANGGVNRSNGSGDTDWEVNARVSGTPWMESKTKFLHAGASGSYMNLNNNYNADGTFSNGGIAFSANPNTNVDRTAILNTGNLTSGTSMTTASRVADHLTRFGAETALVYGPASVQAEYIQTDVSGKGYKDESMKGYYGYGSYFLTGESRAYKAKTGAWDRLKPARNFDMKGGWGAWEIASGYDFINLNSGVINGGRMSTAKVGINWYPNSHVRIMTNYVHVLNIDTQNAAVGSRIRGWNNADLDVLETRVQLDW
ncbi:MAG: porin [Methylococcales bacterium]|nr:porin [Methylococcales bacterium]